MKGNHLLPVLLISTCVMSCQQQSMEEGGDIIGLASPIQLELDSTEFIVQDFITFPDQVKEVIPPTGLLKVDDDQQTILLSDNEKLPLLSTLNIATRNGSYGILVKKSYKESIRLTLEDNGYQDVRVKGEFNSWNVNAGVLENKDDLWSIDFTLSPGKYQYVYVIDGKEILDPGNPTKVDNNNGGFNSLLEIGSQQGDRKPILTTKSYTNSSITIGFDNNPSSIKAFWQNQELEVNTVDNELNLNIPTSAKQIDRSFIRVYAANEYGMSNDLLIPLEQGQVLDNPGQIKRSDKFSQILYFMMVDRFVNGRTDNDFPVDNPEIKPQANHFGGDLAGIIQKIKSGYFGELGTNTIWLSPIPQNTEGTWGLYPDPPSRFSGYHGYWPTSFNKIDYRFGTYDELKELVNEAHKRDMNILLDFVANHVHENHPIYQANKDWATNLYLPDGSLNTERWDDHRLTTWFDVFLPTLNLERQEVTEMLSDSAVFWLKEYELDGFRHDATKHIPHIFWRTLTKKIKQQVIVPENRDVYQIGETYGSRELIASYMNSGELDAQFEFNTYDAAVSVFAQPGTPFSRVNDALQENFKYYGSNHLMGNITGNQDRARFMAYADGSLKFGEDPKYIGWTKNIQVQDDLAYDKLAMLNAFIMTIPGVPVIYYGDEIGITGAGDPDNRRMMRFDNLKPKELALRDKVTSLAHLRRNDLPMMIGSFKSLLIEEDIYAYARQYFDQVSLVFFNKSASQKTININLDQLMEANGFISHFNHEFNQDQNTISITLPHYSFDVLTNAR